MPRTGTRLLELTRNPKSVPAAVVRRLRPRSPTYGFPWVHMPDGSVTFHERGFVSAPSPAMLLARHNYEIRRIRQELEGLALRRSLEVGCGYGRLSMVFSEYSDHHIAIDINDCALSAARAAYPGVDFRHAGAPDLPFPDNHFDLVITWTVIQHVRPERIAQVTASIDRVLAPGGTLLLCEETRNPAGSGGHTWHRTVPAYEALLPQLTLVRHGKIDEISEIPGMQSPGEVMVFRKDKGQP